MKLIYLFSAFMSVCHFIWIGFDLTYWTDMDKEFKCRSKAINQIILMD